MKFGDLNEGDYFLAHSPASGAWEQYQYKNGIGIGVRPTSISGRLETDSGITRMFDANASVIAVAFPKREKSESLDGQASCTVSPG